MSSRIGGGNILQGVPRVRDPQEIPGVSQDTPGDNQVTPRSRLRLLLLTHLAQDGYLHSRGVVDGRRGMHSSSIGKGQEQGRKDDHSEESWKAGDAEQEKRGAGGLLQRCQGQEIPNRTEECPKKPYRSPPGKDSTLTPFRIYNCMFEGWAAGEVALICPTWARVKDGVVYWIVRGIVGLEMLSRIEGRNPSGGFQGRRPQIDSRSFPGNPRASEETPGNYQETSGSQHAYDLDST